MIQNPIVAYDGTEPSLRALKAGLDLASRLHLTLRLITVIEGIPAYISAEAFGGSDTCLIEELARQQTEATEKLLSGAKEIAAAA